MKHEIHVKIGQIRIGEGEDVLKTTLGSCVGIALLWRRKGKYALAHCLLPDAPKEAPPQGAKFVSQAIPALISELGASPKDLRRLEAVVVGGGRMMSDEPTFATASVGELNVEAARKYLELNGIRNVRFDTGGTQGTNLLIDCQSGEYTVRRIEDHDR